MATLLTIVKLMALMVAVKFVASYVWAHTELLIWGQVRSYKVRHIITSALAVIVCLFFMRYS